MQKWGLCTGDPLRKAQIYMTSAVLAFLVLISLSAIAIAPDGRSPEGSDEGAIPYPGMWEGRSFSYERDADGSYLSSMMTEENVTDSVYFSVSIKNGLQICYSASSGNWEEGISMDIGHDVLGLIEFVDTNGNGEYDPEIDELVSTVPLSSSFQYLDFIPGDGPVEPPVEFPVDPDPPSDDEWQKGYNEGYEKGYEVGFQVGTEHAEAGTDHFPDPRGYFPELGDLFNDFLPGDDWIDEWDDDGSYPDDDWVDDWEIPFFEIIENDDGTITVIIINEDGTEEEIIFGSVEEFENWLLENMPGIPEDPENPGYPLEDPGHPPEAPEEPPEDPEEPPAQSELEPYYEGYLFGIMDGFLQGYMDGYGMDSIISYPCAEEDIEYMEDEEIGKEWEKDIWCPEPWPVLEDHFLPIEANTEKYGSDGYELDYTITENDGYVVFDIHASGPLAGENAFKPAIGLEITIDYPYTQNNTHSAVIMETSFSTMSYTGGIVSNLYDEMSQDAPEEGSFPEDVETPQIPWKVFNTDGNELNYAAGTYYKSYIEQEDLHSKSVFSSEGSIISLPASDNDYNEPVEDPEKPPQEEDYPETLPDDGPVLLEDGDEILDDKGFIEYEKETMDQTHEEAISEKGDTDDGNTINVYTITIGVAMFLVIICLSLAAGFLAYRKTR